MSIVRRTSTMSGFRVEHAVKRYLPFQDTRHLLIILIVATLTLLPCGAADECQNEVDVSAARWRVTPLDGSAAGNYTKLNGASDLARCRDACCVLAACNVILLYNEDCYLIACASDAGCEQMPRDDDRFERSAMLAVRPVGKQSATGRYGGRDSPVTADDDDDDYEDVDLGPHDDCDPGAPASCPRGEVCRRRLVGYYVCECPAGTVREFTSRECVDVTDKLGMGADVQTKDDDTQPHTELWKPVVCMFGIDACMPHESCVTNRRARNGVCQCDDGFVREDSTGDCLAMSSTPPSTSPTQPKTSTSQKVNGKQSVDKSIVTSTAPPTPSPANGASVNKHDLSTAQPSVATVSPSSSTAAADNSSTAAPSTAVSSTKKTPSTTSSVVHPLVVSAGDNKQLQLPENEISLSAYTVPNEPTGEYEWALLEHPPVENPGTILGKHTATLTLTELVAGLYSFKVSVRAPGVYGENFVNVTVLAAPRTNKPPVAVITPKKQTVKLPTSETILDGSQSTDDDAVVAYHWEELSAPINQQVALMKDDQATLHLKSLAPGFYQFKLTVTDSDDATNSTIANVTVIKETDYPPTANAGPDKIVKLPSGEITLWGNASTDDHGIASYEWSKTSTTGAVDMQGSHKAFLHLTNLELGDYTFRLKVTDTLGQSSEADVHVFVQPEAQGGPRADAGVDKEISAPNDTVMLDGSNSEGVTTYEWTQLKGPAGAVIVSPAEAQTKVTKLAIAEYEFQLTVKDSQEKSDSASVHVKVKQVENRRPTADAGRPQAMRLPDNLLLLNGSKSSDDLGIISYEWTKQDTSPAAGEFLGRTQLEKIAMVTGFVPGHYVFQLKVTDGQGASATAVTTVEVHPSSHQVELVQMEIDADPMTYTVAQKNELISQLQLLLRTQQDDVIVNIDGLERQQNSGRMIVLFYVTRPVAAAVADGKNKHQPEREMLPGPEVAAQLLKRLKADASVLGTPVYSVDTLVCQNNCSHHGHCEQMTKLCKCDPFWLQNFFKAYLFNEESNCDWSILYFIIVVFILIVTSSCVVWACIWCVRRLRGKKYTKKQHHKYKLLSDEEFSAPDMRKVPKTKLVPRKQQPALFTDSDSDEETLYENAKNGIRIHNVNGFSRRQKKI